MKNLLIVEDDKQTRRGIRTMVQRSGVPIDVILECGSGEQALEVLLDQEIDVMFTAIKMDGMDGLTLVKQVVKLPNKPLIVVISGCDDFAYAVEMLRNGVKDYLLKPVDEDKIKEVLEALNLEVESNAQNSKTDKEFGEQQLRLLLNNQTVSEKDIELLKARYDSFFHQSGFVCLVVGKNDAVSTSDKYILLEDVEDSNLCMVEDRQLTPFINSRIYDYSAGISRTHHGIAEIKTAFDEAVLARKRAFCIGGNVYANDNVKEQPKGLREAALKYTDEQACMQRLQLIGTTKTDELTDLWEKFFCEVNKERISFDDFEQVMKTFVSDVVKIYRNSIPEEQEEMVEEFACITRFTNLATYQKKLMDFIMGLHDRVNAQGENNRSQQKMKQAVDYIEANYNKDLNMAVVSNYVSMNYSLFSFSFKQYTGTNFVNYLKEIRIREAKRLLATTDMKVIDISQTVGYDNEKHFMKMFKSICGVSPTEYRKNMQK